MKLFPIILSVLLFGLLTIHSMAQEAVETETIEIIVTDELIELEGDEGKILVFPSTDSGPGDPIIRFVMFGIYETPEVVIDTMKESISCNVTAIHFIKGHRFYGWFEVPKEEIISIWINGWFIPWGNKQ